VRTPNIDRLAQRGVRFTQVATNCPVCAPARIALATGLQPRHLGALENDAYLPRSATTYYQRLRDHDYRVGCVGKLDLAKPDPFNGLAGDRPTAYGFTEPVHRLEGKPAWVRRTASPSRIAWPRRAAGSRCPMGRMDRHARWQPGVSA